MRDLAGVALSGVADRHTLGFRSPRSDQHSETPVDIFVRPPFEFDEEYDRALMRMLPGAGVVRSVALDTLIRMKESAGRPQDLADLSQLRMLTEPEDDEATS